MIRKNIRFQGGKHTQQVIPQINCHQFGLVDLSTSPLSNHTLPTPNFALYAPLWRCTEWHNKNPRQQGGDNDKGGRQKFFFPSNQPFFRSFSLLPDTHPSTLFCFLLIVFGLLNSKLWTIVFIHRHFILVFLVFLFFFEFFWTTSFTLSPANLYPFPKCLWWG